MARRSEPWFRRERGAWYVWHGGRQVRLAEDKGEAYEKWHDMMALSRVTTAGDKNPFRAVAEQFLDWIQRNKKPKTYKVYQNHLQAFCDVHGDVELRNLKAIHVDDLMKQRPHWSKSTRRGVMVCILTTLNWAVRQGIATRNPLSKKLDIPPIISRGRDSVIPPEDYEKLIAHANGRLKDFLIACRNSGTRPHIVADVTSAHFLEKAVCWVMPEHKTDSDGQPLVIHLNQTLLALTKRLSAERPSGQLFVNNRGNKWTDTAWGKAMAALRKRLDDAGEKLSCSGIMYGFRHTFATDMLESGVPETHVAGLLGHKSTAMLAKHYSHLGSKVQALKAHLSHIKAMTCEVSGEDDGKRQAASSTPDESSGPATG